MSDFYFVTNNAPDPLYYSLLLLCYLISNHPQFIPAPRSWSIPVYSNPDLQTATYLELTPCFSILSSESSRGNPNLTKDSSSFPVYCMIALGDMFPSFCLVVLKEASTLPSKFQELFKEIKTKCGWFRDYSLSSYSLILSIPSPIAL